MRQQAISHMDIIASLFSAILQRLAPECRTCCPDAVKDDCHSDKPRSSPGATQTPDPLFASSRAG